MQVFRRSSGASNSPGWVIAWIERLCWGRHGGFARCRMSSRGLRSDDLPWAWAARSHRMLDEDDLEDAIWSYLAEYPDGALREPNEQPRYFTVIGRRVRMSSRVSPTTHRSSYSPGVVGARSLPGLPTMMLTYASSVHVVAPFATIVT